MKKYLPVILLLLISFSKTFSQVKSVYYDAKDLRALVLEDSVVFKGTDESIQKITDILSTYLKNANTYPLIKEKIKGNPFLEKMLPTAGDNSTESQNVAKSLIESAGGLDVTNLANALADIMIEHAKEELTVAFFNRFDKFIAEHEEFGILFPKTTTTMSGLLAYRYTEMLPALRTSFQEDLAQLAYNIDNVLDLPKYKDFFDNLPEVKLIIESIRTLHELESGASNAADIIKTFSELDAWSPVSEDKIYLKNIQNCLKLSALFSESIRNKDSTTIWIPSKDLKTMMNDKPFFTIYLGLIYEQAKNIKFSYKKKDAAGADTLVSISFTEIMAEKAAKISYFQTKLSEFNALAKKVDDLKKNIENNVNDVTNDDLYNYLLSSIDIIDYSFEFVKTFKPEIDQSEYIALARNANNLYKDIYSKQYNLAATHAFDILSQLNSMIKSKQKEELEAKKDSTNSEEIEKLIKEIDRNKKEITISPTLESQLPKELINAIKKNNYFTNFVEKARPYALFMANIVNAKTEEDIKVVLENAILPVGSSSIKKHSYYNISVQSYLGARYSLNTGVFESSWNDDFGVSAPVGIAGSAGLGRHGGSITLFIPLIDLGAIVDYKLNYKKETTDGETVTTSEIDETNPKDYKIELGQIFSPGAYFVYGLPYDIPLSVGFGGQYGPGLSKIKEDNTLNVGNPYWKWSAFLSVDIPLFNLSSQSKTKK